MPSNTRRCCTRLDDTLPACEMRSSTCTGHGSGGEGRTGEPRHITSTGRMGLAQEEATGVVGEHRHAAACYHAGAETPQGQAASRRFSSIQDGFLMHVLKVRAGVQKATPQAATLGVRCLPGEFCPYWRLNPDMPLSTDWQTVHRGRALSVRSAPRRAPPCLPSSGWRRAPAAAPLTSSAPAARGAAAAGQGDRCGGVQ